MRNKISKRLVKRILKEYWDGEISKDLCIFVKDYLDELTHKIIKELVAETQRENRLRQVQNLPEMKRIALSTFKSLLAKVNKQTSINLTGNIGELNKNTMLVEAEAEVV